MFKDYLNAYSKASYSDSQLKDFLKFFPENVAKSKNSISGINYSGIGVYEVIKQMDGTPTSFETVKGDELIMITSCKKEIKVIKEKTPKTELNSNNKTGALIEISAEQLLKILKYDKSTFVIDVRKADKSIRSCKLINDYKHLEDSLVYKDPNLLPKDKSIVLLSKTGVRSRKLGEFLSQKGMTVYNLKGGMESYWSWRDKLIREKLHIYDEQINVIELYADDFGC